MNDKHSHLESLEPLPFDGLEFPSFIPIGTHKRSCEGPSFPAKRLKGSLPNSECTAWPSEQEDNSWMDSFSLLDSCFPSDDFSSQAVCLTNHADPSSMNDQQIISSSVDELMEKALAVSTPDIFTEPQITNPLPISNNNDEGHLFDSSHLQPGTLQRHEADYHHAHVQVTSGSDLAEDGIPHQPSLVSPTQSPVRPSVEHRHVSPLPMSPQAQQEPMVNTSGFTIAKLKGSKEPTLLTLTSFPYRVIYQNDAFSKLSSGPKACVIGDSIFDTFKVEKRKFRPSLVTYPTLTDRLDNEIAWVPFFTDKQDNVHMVRCEIQASPVTKRSDPNAMLYYAVRFTPL